MATGEVVFLFAQLWARVQILREESLYTNLAADTKGAQLLQFLRALESTRTRLVDRGWQRAMGEALVSRDSPTLRATTYFEFANRHAADTSFRGWFEPLEALLRRMNHTRDRQR